MDRVVVVGGGLAGFSLADELRSRGFGGEIAIIEREPAMYDRPPLSKAAFISDGRLADLAFGRDGRLDALALTLVTDRVAAAIDADAGDVALDDGSVVSGDVLVLATGAQARRLDFPGADAPVVHVLRTFADAAAIRTAAVPGAHLLVVGAGLIGAELAGSLRGLGVGVTLIDPARCPLESVAGSEIAERLHAMHTAHGVDVRVATLRALEADGARWRAELSDGAALRVDAVVVGVGIRPADSLAGDAGIAVDDGVLVDSRHRTSHPRVYAIGDVARHRGEDGALHRRQEHWEAAQLGARELAAVLLGQEPPLRGAPWWWSDRYGIHVEGVGRMTGPGTTVFRGRDIAFHIDGGVVVGAISIDAAPAVRAARRLIDQRLPVDARTLADPAVSLRDLLRAPERR